MSDNRIRYRAIKAGLMQLHPGQLTGRQLQRLNVLAMFISGIIGSGKSQNRQVAKKVPTEAKPDSRIKQLSRWYKNKEIRYDVYYLPYLESLLTHLGDVTLTITLDGSAIGRNCMTMMVSLIYQKRAIPLIWTVLDRPKGHLSAQEHIALLDQFRALVSERTDVVVLGDGEFDSIELQSYLSDCGWEYVCRTAKDTKVFYDGAWLQLNECAVSDKLLLLDKALFTERAYGPVSIVIWWEEAYAAPLFLVSNMELADEIRYWYRRRMRIETLFSDQKSRGFNLHKSHVSDPERLFRIMIAACLAYTWMIFLGTHVHQQGLVAEIHRADRCDLSLFQLGLDWLEHCLNERLAILFDFLLPKEFLFA